MSNSFVCDNCGTVDNIFATQQTGPGFQCHRCKNGEWHNEFPEEQYDPDRHGDMINRAGSDGDTVSMG